MQRKVEEAASANNCSESQIDKAGVKAHAANKSQTKSKTGDGDTQTGELVGGNNSQDSSGILKPHPLLVQPKASFVSSYHILFPEPSF